jgi:hypothetical protein
MSALSPHDAERMLFELGAVHRARTRELERAESETAMTEGAMAPLSETETSALVAATVRRLEKPAARGVSPLGAAAGLAAVAAAVALWLGRAPQELPEYALTSPRSDASSRGAGAPAGEAGHYTIGRELRFVVRSSVASDASVHVSVFSERAGLQRIAAIRTTRAAGGSVIVTLRTGASGYTPEPGPDTLVFALSPRGAPNEDEVRRHASSARLRIVRFSVVWKAP